MLKLQIPKNRMNYLMKQVQLHYDAVILEQGWEYYHKGRVSDAELVGTAIHALVKGGKAYETIVHLEDFLHSECSCSYDGLCKHIAAAFFSLYAPYGRPELLLQQLKKSILTRKKPARTAGPPAEKKSAPPLAPLEQGPAADWHRFFEGRFHGFSITQQQSIEAFYESAREALPAFAAGWRPAVRLLYELHITLFMMRKIEQFYQDTKSSYLSYYHETGCKTAAKHCETRLAENLRHKELPSPLEQEPALWRDTLALLGELALQGKDSPIDWLLVYRFIWWQAAGRADWIQEERKRLTLLAEKKDATSRRRDAVTIAKAHFDVIAGRTEQALQQLDELGSANAADFFLYLQHYADRRLWDDMLVWLRWLHAPIQKANHDDFRTFCQYWLDTIRHLASDAEWVQVMESLLPRSYYYYTAYLLQTKRYRQWVDLQLSNRISPLSLYALELRAIEEYDLELLLPLYHQAAERAVLEKNRASYKTAVRLLKRLHGFYKQLKQEDRWELYIYRLADKFSRLRAFQEELKKGKWIR